MKKKIGEVIRGWRKLRQKNQYQLAEMINMPRTTIAEWEQGKSFPPEEKVYEITNALGIPPILEPGYISDEEVEIYNDGELVNLAKIAAVDYLGYTDMGGDKDFESNIRLKGLTFAKAVEPALRGEIVEVIEEEIEGEKSYLRRWVDRRIKHDEIENESRVDNPDESQ